MDIEGSPSVVDFSPVLLLTLLRYFFEKIINIIYRSFGKKLLVYNLGKSILTKKKDYQKRLFYYSGRAPILYVHIFNTLFAIISFQNEKWLSPNFRLLSYLPTNHRNYSLNTKLYYNFQVSHYLYENLRLLFDVILEKRHSDFTEMLLHHAISLILILFSYFSGYAEVGIIILIIHNISHIFLYISLMSNDISCKNILYVTFPISILSWFTFRQFLFPMMIAFALCTTINNNFQIHSVFMVVFLIGLYCLEVFWGWKMLESVTNYVNKQKKKKPINHNT